MPATRVEKTAIVAAAVLAVTTGAALGWVALRNRGPREPARQAGVSPNRRLLAVLPFENIAGAAGGYFAAGMTQEVTSQLSKLSALRIVGTNAVAQFKDPRNQLSTLAKELGIGSAVSGTVREDGGRVRVNVELIDAASGQVLWSEQYDREGVDVFAAQSDIALRVGQALNASVTLEEQARVGKRPTSSVAAYELYVRARTAPGKTAQEQLQGIDRSAAAARWPSTRDSPRPTVGSPTDCYLLGGVRRSRRAGHAALDAANKAIEIDPALATGHQALG